MRRALAGAVLALASASVSSAPAADPPNVPIVYRPEAVAACERRGTIDINIVELNSDVKEIRSPELRLRVAKLGGNVVLVLPGRSNPKATPAAVYACPAYKSSTPTPKG
jgi:hypothetical protein